MRTTTILLLAGAMLLIGCGRPADSADSMGTSADGTSNGELGTIDPNDSADASDPGDHVAIPPSDPADSDMGGSNIIDTSDPDPAPAADQPTIHTADKGDTFWKLAVKYYNDGKQWKRIAAANPDIKPSSIPVGAKIVIPRD
ncbi:MAG: LysM peptidoglycan-binding domain-containing protein [Phycisphaerae bacterium]